jgi:hypothetical protein
MARTHREVLTCDRCKAVDVAALVGIAITVRTEGKPHAQRQVELCYRCLNELWMFVEKRPSGA